MEISFLEVSPEQKTSSQTKQSTIPFSEGDSPFVQVFRHVFSEQTSEQVEVSPENESPAQEAHIPSPESTVSEAKSSQELPPSPQIEMPLGVVPVPTVSVETLANLITEGQIAPSDTQAEVSTPTLEDNTEGSQNPENPVVTSELTLPVIQSLLFQMALQNKTESKTEEVPPVKQNESAETVSNSVKTASIIARLEAVYLMPQTNLNTHAQIAFQPDQSFETQPPPDPSVQTAEEIPLPNVSVQVGRIDIVPTPQPGSNSSLGQFLQWVNQQLSYLSQRPSAFHQLALNGSKIGLESVLLTPLGPSDLTPLALTQKISSLGQKSPNLEPLKTSSSPPESWRNVQPELSGHPYQTSQTQIQSHHHTALEASRPGPIMHQIVQNVRYLHQHQRSEIRLALDPPQLGRMMLQFIQQPDGLLQLHMVLEQGLAKEMVEASLGQLRQQFQQHNLQIDQIIIETRQSFDQDTPHSEQQFEEPEDQTKTQTSDNLLAEFRGDETINQELLINLSPYINYLV